MGTLCWNLNFLEFVPCHEKNGPRSFRPGPILTGLYSHRRGLGVCTIYVAKTKALINCAVTAQLICVFVFAFAKSRFSHDVVHVCKYEDFDMQIR